MSSPALLGHYISGAFVERTGGDTIESLNPSEPAEVVALSPSGTAQDVDNAVQAASGAFSAWRALSGRLRGDQLYAWAGRVEARAEELAQAVAREVGKPIGEARGEVGRCVALLRYFAGEAVRPLGEVIPALSGGSLQFAVRQPLGAIALVTPWNFPLAIPIWKAAPALAVGNTVVLKPSELSPFCGHLLAETAAGLPVGVFNVVHGKGETGQALVSHRLVRAVSFTGSVGVGALIQQACAARNVKCQCEMGGKNAAVVLKDADLVRAAGLIAAGAMRFAGQKCTATSRVIVESAVWEAFLTELSKAVEALPVGPVTEAATALGPVIDKSAQTRLADVLSGSKEPVLYESGAEGHGYYVRPTVLGPVAPDSPLAQDELFGPVLAAIPADSFDHAVEITNGTKFGLSTALYTKDIGLAMKYIDRIEAGMVRINGDTTGVDLHAPFGGMKASSSGTREQGAVAKDFYTEWKTVQVNP